MADSITDNPTLNRFELPVGGQVVFATYRRQDGTLVIPHVEAPPSLRGTGAAGRLMEGIMVLARSQNLKVRPLCSYAALWVRRHKEFHDLLA